MEAKKPGKGGLLPSQVGRGFSKLLQEAPLPFLFMYSPFYVQGSHAHYSLVGEVHLRWPEKTHHPKKRNTAPGVVRKYMFKARTEKALPGRHFHFGLSGVELA